MSRKMLILGALPLPCEGVWVPLGSGVWICDFRPELAGKVSIEVEDFDGKIHTRILGEKTQVEGKRIRAIVTEEVELDTINIGVTRTQ